MSYESRTPGDPPGAKLHPENQRLPGDDKYGCVSYLVLLVIGVCFIVWLAGHIRDFLAGD